MADSKSAVKKGQEGMRELLGETQTESTPQRPEVDGGMIAMALRDINEMVGPEFDEEEESVS